MTVAALYVQTGGAYYGLDDVDPWDEARDARLYDGPWPVVAHPPCSRWCMLASVNEARYGHAIGDDGGTFKAALEAVRRFGGVLEHPAYSIAWDTFALPVPSTSSGWTQTLTDSGWSTEIAQAAYGHRARKRTWLYYIGPNPPVLDWRNVDGDGVVGAGVHSGQSAGRPRVQGSEASATPAALRDVLLDMARSAAMMPV